MMTLTTTTTGCLVAATAAFFLPVDALKCYYNLNPDDPKLGPTGREPNCQTCFTAVGLRGCFASEGTCEAMLAAGKDNPEAQLLDCCTEDCCNYIPGQDNREFKCEGFHESNGNTLDQNSVDICEKGGKGVFLPIFESEADMSNALRALLYFFGLLWLFAGVAIVADVFMAAIETITSQQRAVTYIVDNKVKTYQVQVWNDTIANLSLMALGSSAPEILLSVIELLGNNFYAGELGPSTIVGSAAFNMLCIIAVCVVAIPDGEKRKIKQYDVFIVTAFCSIFAYVWLVIILLFFTPDLVTPEEGTMTFLFFPILLAAAYGADHGLFSGLSKKAAQGNIMGVKASDGHELSRDELAKITKRVKAQYGNNLSDTEMAAYVSQEASKALPKSRAFYRIEATRTMTAGKPVSKPSALTTGYQKLNDETTESAKKATLGPYFEFDAMAYSIAENAGILKITVIRGPNTNAASQYGEEVRVSCKTIDGTAIGTAANGTDFVSNDQVLVFKPNENKKFFEVEILDDLEIEDDEDFTVELYDPMGGSMELGEVCQATVTIIDDDMPGKFVFPDGDISCKESDGALDITVQRIDGCSGRVTVDYETKNGTAFADSDYKPVKGTLVFEEAESKKTISVEIIDDEQYERDEVFLLILSNPTNGAKLNNDLDKLPLAITIVSDDDVKGGLDRIMDKININVDQLRIGSSNYKQQFIDALSVNGGGDDDDEEPGPPSAFDWIVHIICLPFKILFAFIPPTDFAGGWACFLVALTFIGLVTAFIGDMASLLGCVVGMPDALTAITLVALGTSLPDTFASKSAAVGDPTADNSIGNVTGSNSVNVFLGLGLPWMVGAIYWKYFAGATDEWKARYPEISARPYAADGGFAVPAGSLAASVAIFCFCAGICLALLVHRRRNCGGELGGAVGPKKKHAALMVFLWLFYIFVSAILIFQDMVVEE